MSRLYGPAPTGNEFVDLQEHHDPALLAATPPPVQRYLASALAPGQRTIRRARLEHAGEFAAQPGRWGSFSSVQYVTTGPPGFVWTAAISMKQMPVDVRVRDSYVHGIGATHAAVGGVIPLGGQEGTPEVGASALWRYLAEAVWYPTALLPSERVTWAAVDDSTSRVTLRDRGATAIADFHFGVDGEVVRITGTRYRAVGGGQVLTPTEARLTSHARIDNMLIPTEGELAWLLPEGAHTYWRARLTDARYEYEGR